MVKPMSMTVAGKPIPPPRASTAAVLDALGETVGNTSFPITSGPSSRSRPVTDISALLGLVSRGRADIAIIEAGEMPLKFSGKLEIGAVLKRGNPFNVIISNEEMILDEFPAGISIAVGDPGIRGQILSYRDDIEFVDRDEDYEGFGRCSTGERTGGLRGPCLGSRDAREAGRGSGGLHIL